MYVYGMSPSSRRAWIEIVCKRKTTIVHKVALLAEGVDRNVASFGTVNWAKSRPPRGGRG